MDLARSMILRSDSAVRASSSSLWSRAKALKRRTASSSTGFTRSLRSPSTRSEEHTSELQSLMRISYAVFCLKKKKQTQNEDKLYSTHYRQHMHMSKIT